MLRAGVVLLRASAEKKMMTGTSLKNKWMKTKTGTETGRERRADRQRPKWTGRR